MIRDPFVNPIPLAFPRRGLWTWKDDQTGAVFKGENFWIIAKKIWKYRKLNKRPNAQYERAQLDLLIAKRTELGLPMTLRGQPSRPASANTVTDEALDRQARLDAWKQRRKPKGGCRSCGKTKTIR